MWEFFDTFQKDRLENYNAILNVALSLTKLCGVVGLPVGLLLIIAYVRRVHSPLPVLDPSSAATLLLVVAVYGFFIMVLALLALFPAFSDLRSSETYKKVRYLLSWRFSPNVGGLWTYIIFHAGSLTLFPFIFIFVEAFGTSNPEYIPAAILGGLVLSFLVCPALSVAIFRSLVAGKSIPSERTKKKKAALASKVWGEAFQKCLIMLIWAIGLSRVIVPDAAA